MPDSDTRRMISTFIGPTDPLWRAVLERTAHDFYHLPEYVTLSGRHENGKPLAFYSEAGEAACLIPLLARRLPPHLDAPQAWCDLVSPYGYSAPLFTHPGDGEGVARFIGSFCAAADELGACSVLLRLHPLLKAQIGWMNPLTACVRHGQTVWIDLTHSEEEFWQETRENHRRGIRRLEQMKFSPVMDDWSLYEDFKRMYAETMVLVGAGQFYRFSEQYFATLRATLGEKLHLCCAVSLEGRPVAGGLFTTEGDVVQYHLGGSDQGYRQLSPMKLVIHFVRLWGKQRGYSIFHLGGGAGALEDSLFRFKAGFSPYRSEFLTLRMIPNERRYVAATHRAGRPVNLAADLEADYFPPYRFEWNISFREQTNHER